jgi:hypothetical protein
MLGVIIGSKRDAFIDSYKKWGGFIRAQATADALAVGFT